MKYLYLSTYCINLRLSNKEIKNMLENVKKNEQKIAENFLQQNLALRIY